MKPPRTLEEALQLIAQLLQRIVDLEAKVAVLEEQVRQSSQNSSRPPSTDPPTVERPPARPPSGRRPGAQPGQPAPDFTLPAIHREGKISLADYKGRSPLLLGLFRGIY